MHAQSWIRKCFCFNDLPILCIRNPNRAQNREMCQWIADHWQIMAIRWSVSLVERFFFRAVRCINIMAVFLGTR